MKNIFKLGLVMFLVGLVGTAVLSASIKKADLEGVRKYFNKYSNLDEKDAIDYSFDEKFSFENVQDLKLEVIFGDIEIYDSQDHDLHVTLKSRIHKDLKPTSIQKLIYQDGQQVHINLMDLFTDKNNSSNFMKIDNQSITVSNDMILKIAIPKQYKKLSVDSVSADYKIKNLKLDTLKINTVSGDLNLDQVSSSVMKMDAVSGDIQLNDPQFEQIKLDIISGDVQFKLKAPADIVADVTAVSGELKGDDYFKQYISENTLKLGKPKQKITVDSVSGDVEFSKQ